MSASLTLPLLWGQIFLRGVPAQYQNLMGWMYAFGEPNVMAFGYLGAFITWLKVVSLFCLLGWSAFWVGRALKERIVFRKSALDILLLILIVGWIGTQLWHQLEIAKRIPTYRIMDVRVYDLMTNACLIALFLWLEAVIWKTIVRLGSRADVLVLLGIHLALAVGLLFGAAVRQATIELSRTTTMQVAPWSEMVFFGVRMAATYMGYVVLLRVAIAVAIEIFHMRFRRLYSIGKLTWTESNRRMWAPWVVITLFLVVLAFTHWFLQPPRPAEMGRLYVGTISLLCTMLLTLMVTFLTPLSLPNDITSQTIYTVVSKPVRRIELIWGRIAGYMALVSVLVLLYGVISLAYLSRTVGGKIIETEKLAVEAAKKQRMTEARQYKEAAEQLRTRMTARVPVTGFLSFLDSKGNPHLRGIDVGQEQSSTIPRSHIEGATSAVAIWTFDRMYDPLLPEGQRERSEPLDYRIPVDQLLTAGTAEGLLDKTYQFKTRIAQIEQLQASGQLDATQARSLAAEVARAREELTRATEEYEKVNTQSDDLKAKIAEARKAGKPAEEQSLRERYEALHSRSIPMEMTFTIYRTTKGRIGEPVHASIEATNPVTGARYTDIFPIREYYTNKQLLPAEVLAGSQGRLTVKIQCISPTQYLGMAQPDLFLLAESGRFGTNFMKGLFGIWLQAMVLTAIGVFAGTFLSWPVALLTTLSFFIAGQVAFTFLIEFTRQSLLGGGPFESLIRLVSHENQMTDLAPTLPVLIAKTLDSLVMPVMSRLVYIVPNLAALDFTNKVANGFALNNQDMISGLLFAIAYAMPFSIAGYFILKNREVAA
jgi:hypothetical protein